MTEDTKRSKYSFDLSDGFGKEDIRAIFSGIWRFIIGILKIIFWPYVWISRIFGRSIRFIRVKATDNPLSSDERAFIESIPGFFVLTGFFGGILFVVIVYLLDWGGLASFFDNIELTSIIEAIAGFLGVILEIILWIIGYDKRDADGNVILDRFGILDILGILFDIMASIVRLITEHPLGLFLGIGVIGVVIAGIWIIISETGIVSSIISIISRIFGVVVTTPHKGFNTLNNVYLRFNHILGGIIIGEKRLSGYSVSYHKKIIMYTFFLGFYTFLAGIFVIATQDPPLTGDTLYFMIFTILFTLGLGVGILELFIIVRFIDIVSRGSYDTGKGTVQSE
ncbi:MAG: hypothetical protein ACFFDT_10500 [Candidatus Hodarchaeota archaeon]